MSVASIEEIEIGNPAATLADLFNNYGENFADRIRVNPAPGTATVADVIAIHASEDRLYELVDGVLVEKAMGSAESFYAGVMIHLLWTYLDINPIGGVLSPDGMVRVRGGRIRMPDVSYVSWGRMPGGKLPKNPVIEVSPDLVIEIISPSITTAEMSEKLRDYFESGTTLVWYMDPDERSVRVYTSPDQVTLVAESGTLDGDPVLPGFQLPVREWFARAERRGL